MLKTVVFVSLLLCAGRSTNADEPKIDDVSVITSDRRIVLVHFDIPAPGAVWKSTEFRI
jgi:hypothetical protein